MNQSRLTTICVVLAVSVVPLILMAHPVKFGGGVGIDLYSWGKSAAIIILAVLASVRRPPLILIAPVVAACLASAAPPIAWWGFPYQFLGGAQIIALIALGCAASRVDPRYIFAGIGWGASAIATICIAQKFGFDPVHIPLVKAGHDVAVYSTGLISSTLYNSNYVGLYGALVIPIMAGRLSANRPMYVFPVSLMTVAIIMSGSRTGWLGLVVGMVVVFCMSGDRVVSGLLAVSAVFSVFKVGDWTLSGRTEIWGNALPLLSWFGSGPGVFPLAYNGMYEGGFVDKPHSFYLQFAHAFGGVGLGVSIAAVAVVLLGHYAIATTCKDRNAAAILAGLVGFFVAAAFNDLYIGVAPVFAVVLGAAMRRA